MRTTQKFERGDVVRIAVDLGPSMSHFRADTEAIVLNVSGARQVTSYPLDGHPSETEAQYGVMFLDTGAESSWYKESQLTYIRHGGEYEIARISIMRQERIKNEKEISWIVENWATIRDRLPRASKYELIRRMGLKSTFGSFGSGYRLDATTALRMLDPILASKDLPLVESFLPRFRELLETVLSECGTKKEVKHE
jgi:hypothetical protein